MVQASQNFWKLIAPAQFSPTIMFSPSRLIGRAVPTLPDDRTHRKVWSSSHFIDDFTTHALFSKVPHPAFLANQGNSHSILIARTVPGFPRNGSGRETCSRQWNIDGSGDSANP